MLLRTDVSCWWPVRQTHTCSPITVNYCPFFFCPVGSACLLVTGVLLVPPRQPTPDLWLTHSISARWPDLIEAHTHAHNSVPCEIGQGLLRFTGRLPVDHSACASPCIHIWMNNTQVDVQHRHRSTNTVCYALSPPLHQWCGTTLLPWLVSLQGQCHSLWPSCRRSSS